MRELPCFVAKTLNYENGFNSDKRTSESSILGGHVQNVAGALGGIARAGAAREGAPRPDSPPAIVDHSLTRPSRSEGQWRRKVIRGVLCLR